MDHPIVIVDDVLTTGASLMNAIQAIRDEGFDVKYVFCILERGENNELKKQCQVYAIVQAFGFQAIHTRRNTETRRAKNSGITTIFQHPSKTPDESTEPNNL